MPSTTLHLEPSFNFPLSWVFVFIRNLLNRPYCTPKFQQLSSWLAPICFSTDAFSWLPSNPTEAVSGPHPTPRDSFGVVFICTEPTASARRPLRSALAAVVQKARGSLRTSCADVLTLSTAEPALVTGEDSPSNRFGVLFHCGSKFDAIHGLYPGW